MLTQAFSPSSAMTNTEPSPQSRPDFNAKLWKCDILKSDSDVLNVPKSSTSLVPAKVKKPSEPHPVPVVKYIYF